MPNGASVLQLLGQVQRQRVALGDRVDPDLRDEILGREHLGGVLEERLAEGVDLRAGDRQARRGLVAAVAQQVPGARVQAAEQVEGADRAARAAALLTVERDQDRGPVVALGDPRGDDPDHAGMPALGGEHERAAFGMLGDERLGLEADPGLDVAALGVDAVELLGDGLGPFAVLGQQQLEPRVGAVQAPGGVQPRAEPEADRGLVEPARVHARDVHQRPQADLARARPAPSGPRGRAGGSRPAAARRRPPWPARRGPDPRRPAPGPPPLPPAAPGRACRRRPRRTGRRTGSRSAAGGRAARPGSTPSARGE